ncbi:hypothetical protein AMELA_G00244970 [Ameiurus melas]|uniref:Uncharacterized protein n=1 Tax=Ameiurus melas TaxID=219545 RepID=A0A7J5ZT56_AMEME|nr:hypothetical protein AMELA_G00244970 [Ameiurus melas]
MQHLMSLARSRSAVLLLRPLLYAVGAAATAAGVYYCFKKRGDGERTADTTLTEELQQDQGSSGLAWSRAAFNEVLRQLRDIEGVRYGILHPARLRITYNGVQKDIISAEEAGDYIKLLISG